MKYIFVVFIVFLGVVICQNLAETESLFEKCLEQSACMEEMKCQIEMEHCEECEKMVLEFDSWAEKNRQKQQCYSNCLYGHIDPEEDDQISDQAFDFLFCLKSKIQSLDQFKPARSAYVIKNHHLVKKAFKKYPNWNLVENPQYSNWNLKWDFYHRRLNYNKKLGYQMGNKIRNLQEVMGNKVDLLNLLREYDQNGFYELNSSQFFPQTFVIDLLGNQNQEEQQLYNQDKDYWIIKNPSGYGGEGIIILKSLSEVKQHIEKQRNNVRKNYKEGQETKAIVQKYIENPMLLSNKKFDVRSFVLVACTEPFLVLYHEGYFRKTLENFDMRVKPFNLDAKIRHLTNSHMQEKSSKWQSQSHEHGVPYKESMELLKQQYKLSDDQIRKMDKQMIDILAYTFGASLDKLDRYPGSFHLTGMDFMMDDELNVVFLEANQNPRLQEQFRGEKAVSPFIAQSTIDIVLQILEVEDVKERTRMLADVEKYFDLKGWTVLINEASSYNILDSEDLI